MCPQPSATQPEAARREAFSALKTELSAGRSAAPRTAAEPPLTTGILALDRLLGGGVPCGTLLALEGNAGAWSIAARLAAHVTRRALAAIIDDGGLYPPTLAQAGVRLDRVLVVPARSPLGIARAADILIRSRACRLVLMTAPALRDAVWSRLAALAHRTGVVLVAIAGGLAAAPLAAAAGLRLLCTRERAILAGLRGVWSTLCGYVVRAEIRKAKGIAPGSAAAVRVAVESPGITVRECGFAQRSRPARAALR